MQKGKGEIFECYNQISMGEQRDHLFHGTIKVSSQPFKVAGGR